MLATVQEFLFDSGRMLLTVAVILFLGYAIFVVAALLISAMSGVVRGAMNNGGARRSSAERVGVMSNAGFAKLAWAQASPANIASVSAITGAH